MICYGHAVHDLAEELVDAYADVFSRPPWNEDEETIRRFAARLQGDIRRQGFRAAFAQSSVGVDGFATGWITRRPFASGRGRARVSAQLGKERVEQLLLGALEIDELAVRQYARRQGVGRMLLAEIVADAPDARAWLIMARKAGDAVATYRRLGWHEVSALPGASRDLIVFLSPDHPDASAA
ncbi:GNAT family N-acetyltransferase [Streptomyces sp. NPDC006879]|uniref:GNAT family N-acetyltransferase n=1 Tax=Streptomyces sp. NPDC006879 TaxID=3364767 RepID=UPI00367F2DD8